jgi:Cu-Zn family superoxide dismutase
MKLLVPVALSFLFLVSGFLIGTRFYHISPFHTPLTKATAVIHPTKGNKASGSVVFSLEDHGVKVVAHISGLTPGEHGFHIHEYGDCNCDDAVCAGDHFNPTNEPHASPHDAHRHAGDLGNIVADEHGNAQLSYIDSHLTLNGPHSIVGKAVIVHADKDDLVSQPTGNAGKRIGCGVIGTAKP